MDGFRTARFGGDNDPRATLKKRERFSDVDLTLPRLWMGGHTLEEREGVTYSVGLVRCQCGGVDRRVDVDDLLAKTKKKEQIKRELAGW